MFKYLTLTGAAIAQNLMFDSTTINSQTFSKAITQGVASVTYTPLQDYGCWCYFAEKHIQGRGPAKDSYDAACKQMARGYECAILDEPACVPWEQTYQPDWLTNMFAVLGVHASPESVVPTCEANNPGNNCAQMACMIEGTFIAKVFGLNLDPNAVMNSDYKQSNGFDNKDQANCPVNTQVRGDADDACCGDYPNRRPYRFKTGVRECCNENNKATVYNSGLFECCPDGTIQAAC